MLRHPEDRRAVTFVGAALALLGVGYLGWVRHPLTWAASCAACFLACVVNHNHQHHPMFRGAGRNRAFSLALTFAMGFPATTAVMTHNRNHHDRFGEADDTVHPGALRTGWRALDFLLFPLVCLPKLVAWNLADFPRLGAERPALHRQLILEHVLGYGAALVATWCAPRQALVWLWGPWAFGQWGIVAINYVQHEGCELASPLDHSQDVVGSTLNWWLLNNGFHTAHHLRPGAHWTRLPGLHAELCRDKDPSRVHPSLTALLCARYLGRAT